MKACHNIHDDELETRTTLAAEAVKTMADDEGKNHLHSHSQHMSATSCSLSQPVHTSVNLDSNNSCPASMRTPYMKAILQESRILALLLPALTSALIRVLSCHCGGVGDKLCNTRQAPFQHRQPYQLDCAIQPSCCPNPLQAPHLRLKAGNADGAKAGADQDTEFRGTTSSLSELLCVLGGSTTAAANSSQNSLHNPFQLGQHPVLHHPDYLMQLYNLLSDALPLLALTPPVEMRWTTLVGWATHARRSTVG
ncbi:unnamed protein product [Cyclocybe aegerita]|uniref:Uncharacterized protein n=1 Tax=Cyclocybe aegerita TaxID=1973307 RepID=A0A8S0XQ45_CYCAE|nr:unnamed protein product [Cyclocybe aegerita]